MKSLGHDEQEDFNQYRPYAIPFVPIQLISGDKKVPISAHLQVNFHH